MLLLRKGHFRSTANTPGHQSKGKGAHGHELRSGDHNQGSATSLGGQRAAGRQVPAGERGKAGQWALFQSLHLSLPICFPYSQFQGFHHSSTQPVVLKVWSSDQQQSISENVTKVQVFRLHPRLLTEKPWMRSRAIVALQVAFQIDSEAQEGLKTVKPVPPRVETH